MCTDVPCAEPEQVPAIVSNAVCLGLTATMCLTDRQRQELTQSGPFLALTNLHHRALLSNVPPDYNILVELQKVCIRRIRDERLMRCGCSSLPTLRCFEGAVILYLASAV